MATDQSKPLTTRQAAAMERLLGRVASWSTATWVQHLRYDVGDADAEAIVAWMAAQGVRARPQ